MTIFLTLLLLGTRSSTTFFPASVPQEATEEARGPEGHTRMLLIKADPWKGAY